MISRFRRHRRAAGEQRGSLLVESLLLVTLVSVFFMAAADGMLMSMRATAMSGSEQVGETRLSEAAEAIKTLLLTTDAATIADPTLNLTDLSRFSSYIRCATPTVYNNSRWVAFKRSELLEFYSADVEKAAVPDFTVTDVQYLTFTNAGVGSYQSSCPTAAADEGVQRVTYTVTLKDVLRPSASGGWQRTNVVWTGQVLRRDAGRRP